jgi:hypothetical protein
VALVLSTYPGKAHQMAHAVGLDALASAEAMLADLADAGYRAAPGGPLAGALMQKTLDWPLDDYRTALQTLPAPLRQALQTAWGAPEGDPAVAGGKFRFAALRRGNVLVALQPERGQVAERDGEYHDLSRTPRHGYVAFYLWLRQVFGAQALVHIGAHGTLEWLPGKAVALSDTCWPEALTGDLPVIYPFIVNDPGEAAQAKRRIGALTLGHIPPALRPGGTPERLARLEGLLDEFSNADGLDPRRRDPGLDSAAEGSELQAHPIVGGIGGADRLGDAIPVLRALLLGALQEVDDRLLPVLHSQDQRRQELARARRRGRIPVLGGAHWSTPSATSPPIWCTTIRTSRPASSSASASRSSHATIGAPPEMRDPARSSRPRSTQPSECEGIPPAWIRVYPRPHSMSSVRRPNLGDWCARIGQLPNGIATAPRSSVGPSRAPSTNMRPSTPSSGPRSSRTRERITR